MKRLTSNNTFEMDVLHLLLNPVYIKDGYVWYRGGGPEQDVSVCDLIRAAADTLQVELPMLNDDDLSDLMLGWLQYGEEEPEGVLAILFRALWAMAELRDKLSRYEDTGLEPEEITTGPYGCVFYCNRKCNLDGDWCAEGPGCQQELEAETAKHLLELAQAEKGGRLVVLPPNDLLTLEELREMDGEPVWIAIGGYGHYAVVRSCGDIFTEFTDGSQPSNDTYGIYWLAYRRKPEEAAP